MTVTSETSDRIAGDEFARLTGPYRGELLAYCYRMLGSVHDAEDQVQETLLRAWRGYGAFEGRASTRTWLYRIATNACLRALERRGRLPLPSGLGAPADDPLEPLVARTDLAWLEPIPDALLGGDPAAVASARAGIRLALTAALQYLAPRQRAVLILRDVLGWRAAEVAELIGTTTTAVNSALRRARAQLASAAPAPDAVAEPAEPARRALLERYAAAFAEADVAGLMAVLTEDAVAEMPPNPAWFRGRDAIVRFLTARVFAGPRAVRLVPTAANTQPAFAVYLGEHAHAIHVLTLAAGGVRRVVSFQDPALFPVFDLPDRLAR